MALEPRRLVVVDHIPEIGLENGLRLEQLDAHAELGREHNQLIVDLNLPLPIDALALICGTLVAGAEVIVVRPRSGRIEAPPSMVSWPWTRLPSQRFSTRMLAMLAQESPVATAQENQPLCDPPPGWQIQWAAHAAHMDPHFVGMIHARRGRGKSTALAQLINRVVALGHTLVWLSAPSRRAVAVLLSHLDNDARQSLRFVGPDSLSSTLQHSPAPVFIDEAGAIQIDMLRRILAAGVPVTMAGTNEGYEGAGRGLSQHLLTQVPQLHTVRLQRAQRFASADPLEQWMDQLLALHPVSGAYWAAGCYRVDRDQISEAQLAELFQLLHSSHYRTRPRDLWQLLDGVGSQLWIAAESGSLRAVAVVTSEGGLPPPLAQQVARGQRRVQGHLLPQLLSRVAGPLGLGQTLARQRYWRIVRIAARPQRRGWGAMLVQRIIGAAALAHIDWLGSSFAAQASSLQFWQRWMQVVHVGARREASSGLPAVAALRPLSRSAHALWPCYRAFSVRWLSLHNQYQYQYQDQNQHGDAQPASPLTTALSNSALSSTPLSDAICQRYQGAFAAGEIDWHSAYPALRESPTDAAIVHAALANFAATAQACGGRKALLKQLRSAICRSQRLAPDKPLPVHSVHAPNGDA